MAKQIIDIGVQGNDGTGDSIRDSFRKVNENFTEIYSIFGQGRITLSQLGDGTEYAGNQLIMGNLAGSNLTARNLVNGSNIEININNEEVVISSRAAQLSDDVTPEIKHPFNVNFNPIGRVAEPSQALVDAFNLIWDDQTAIEDLPVTVGYANKNFLGVYNGTVGYKDQNGNIIQPSLTAGSTQLDTTSEFYDPTLTGNYLSTSIVPRKDLVYRGGDTMTGKLYLNDHPGELAGVIGTNSKSDYQAATAYYVDKKTFSSNVNLYVSTSGDDLQTQTPVGKEGRFWNYAFKSIGSALLHAESLINIASQEPGPYKQRVSYTLGPDQYFSKIQKVSLTGGNTGTEGYVAAYNLLQANREFIQAETIAYINKKYVNSFAYNHTELTAKIASLIENVGHDIVLGSTNPNANTSGTNYNSYWEGVNYVRNNPTSDGLIQWLETVNYVRDQIIDFSYDEPALQAYTSQIIDALAYDVLFLSNYQSMQSAIAFKNAGTKISTAQLVSMLTVNPIKVTGASCNGANVTLIFGTQSSIIFPVGSQVLINATLSSKTLPLDPVTISSYVNNSVVAYTVTAATTSSITFAKGTLNLITDDFSVSSTSSIDTKNLINQLLLTPAVRNLPTAVSSINSNIKVITNYLLTGVLPEVSYPQPLNPGVLYDTEGHVSARQLLLENIPFIQAETLAFLSSEFPTVIYDRALCIRDVKYVIWSLVYDSMYGGNSQSIYAGKHYWATLSSNYIKDSEKEACISAVRHINVLVQSIIQNDTVGVTYQQSVRQYKNDTLVNGGVVGTLLNANIELIADILTDIANIPGIIDYPDALTSISELETVYTDIISSKSIYTTGSTTSTSWFMNHFYPVINDATNQTKITNLFKDITDTIESGEYPTVLPNFPLLEVVVNDTITPEQIDEARAILTMSTIDAIALDTSTYINDTYGPGTPDNLTINVSQLTRDVKNTVIAMTYDITFGGTSGVVRAASNMPLIGTRVITQSIFSKAADLTTAEIIGNITNDPANHVATLIEDKFNAAASVFNVTPGTEDPVDFSLYIGNLYVNSINLKDLIINNSSSIILDTIKFVDTKFAGGFEYDESLCFRDLGYLVDSMSIDIITGGTWQSINSGKSFYKNASARTIAIGGSHFVQSFDGITFAKKLGLQVLNKQTAVRYQSIQQVLGFSLPQDLPSSLINVSGSTSATVSQNAITKFTDGMNAVLDILQYGISVAAVPTYGSGIWHVVISNGGRGYVDQGAPLNNDIFPAKVVAGVGSSTIPASEAYASIVKYVPGEDTSGAGSLSNVDTIQVRLTKPGFFKINEELEFGETVRDLNITVFVESGIYYEDYPLRLPSNISIKGDEFRRTLIRPRDRISQSPWRKIFFYRDAVIDGLEIGKVNYDGTDFAPVITSVVTFTDSGDLITLASHGFLLNTTVTFLSINTTTGLSTGVTYYVIPISTNTFKVSSALNGSAVTLTNDGTGTMSHHIAASLDGVTNKIVVTLSNNYQALLSWVGKVIADTTTTNNAKRGRAVIDSISGNTFNCTVIYPFTTSGTYAPGTWKMYDTNNYGRHYLTDPLDVTSPAKNNKEIDVFLCNEGNRVLGLTFQGHGGFAMVLDPEGNIKTKSPYIQECSSFSQSNNYKRFAGGQFIDGFVGRLYGTITNIADNGLTITVVGETNSGLDIRPPQPPCSFYVRGKRYQIDDVVSFDADTRTVVLTLDKSTTYMYDPVTHELSYNLAKAQRDVGYVIDAAATDAILGTNYRSVHAGRAFLRSYSSLLIGGLQDLTIAGINKSADLANTYFSNTSLLSDNIRIITGMIANGVNASPTITWSTSATSDDNKARDIIQNNKEFIKTEISAWLASGASGYIISNYPRYNVLTSERDISYALDSITYDLFYGGNSQTYDSAISFYYLDGTNTQQTVIPGEKELCTAAQTRLKTILQQIVAGTTVSKSAGNSLTQVTANPPSSPSSYVTKVGTLCDLIIDYIADGAFTVAPTVTFPTLPAGANTTAYNTVTANISTLATTVTTFLNNGANLRINLETGGNRAMLANDFAMFNDLAYGIIATNGAFTEQVCTFTYYAHTGLWANNGSNLRGVGCSNTFGDYGMRASGYDVTELPDSTNLANHMIQTAKVYKQGLVIGEMTPTATTTAGSVWIIGYDYIPTNGSSLEIDHSVNGGIITKYSVTSVEYTTIQVANQIVLKLNLSSSGTSSSASGLTKPLYHGQLVTLRSTTNVKFINVDNVKPTRPSTALQYNDNLNDVYRIIAYNLTESTGDLLGSNIAILQSDNDFAYYSFIVDPANIINGDPASNITATIASGSTSSTTITVNSVVGTILQGHTISGIGFAGQTVSSVTGPVTGVYTIVLSAAPSLTPTQTVSFSFATQGSKISDTKIAVSQVNQQSVIDQINKGTYITAWNGRLHRVLKYTVPTFAATRTFVSYNAPTLVVSGNSGTIVVGTLIIGKNSSTGAIEFTGTVVSSDYDSVSTYTTVIVSGGSGSPSAGSTITFGVSNNGYLEISPNAIINNAADGTAAPAMVFNSSTLQTGSSVNKVVTFDLPYNKNNLLPKVDSYITIAGNSNSAYNGSYHVTSVTDQTTLTIGSTAGYVPGMVVTSQYVVTTIASGKTFTTSFAHQLSLNDIVTANTTTNGLDATVTYYVKTAPTTTTFTLSLSSGGTELTSFTNGTSLQISIQTPTTARMATTGSIVQSVDSVNNQIVVSPACWAPVGAPIRATLAASVLRIDISSGGTGYDQAPLLTVVGGSPTQTATATCTVVNGVINQVNVIIKGYGYTTQPTVLITPAPGTVFTGTTAVLSVVLSTPVYRDSTASAGLTVTQMSVLYSGDPGVFGTNTSKTISAAGTPTLTTYNSVSGYSVAYTYATMGSALTANSWYRIEGNSNSLYNGFVQVISSADATHAVVFYPYNPGTYGTGTTTIVKTDTAGTSSSLGISKPFDVTSSYTLKLGYAVNTGGQVTTRISTCRATGHDFCDIGTGGYSTTNIPYSIYGDPALSRNASHETLDEGVGRCFYVSTNQDGIFRVGRFFSVDQGTGTVTFSAKISLSNIEGFGFSRGVVVNEFSSDSSLTNNAAEIVPVQSAVRGYIDKRLGLDHGGSPVPFSTVIGPGFLPLNGSLTMSGDINMGNHRITGLMDPAVAVDVATKGYVDNLIDLHNTFAEMADVTITSAANSQMLVYNFSSSKWINKTLTGDITIAYNSGTGVLESTIGTGKIVNTMVSSSAAIAQSKLALSAASTRANATGITQSDLGVASFNNTQFTSSNGWIELVDSSSTSTGIPYAKLQYITNGTLLGNRSGSTGPVSLITPAQVVTDGDGVKNASFTSSGVMIVSNVSPRTYSVINYTSSGEASKIVQTGSDGGIDAQLLKIDSYKIIDTDLTGQAATTNVIFTTPGNVQFMKSSGDTVSETVMFGTVNITGANTLLKSTTLSSGATTTDGVITGKWKLAAGSSLDTSLGSFNSSAEGLTASEAKPKIRPSVLFDFANSRILDPRITFTRNSIATYYNSNGLLTVAVAGQPRFDYDPETGVSNGLLLEEARTNYLQQSESFQSWTLTNVTKSSLPIGIAPDGIQSVYQFTSSANNGKVEFNVTGTAPSGVYRTLSVWLKRISGTGPISVSLDGGTNWYSVVIDTTLTRYSITQSNSTRKAAIRIETSGDVIQIWGAQLEDGACMTSYIPTTTTSITRNLDDVSITDTNFSKWYRQDEGTVILAHTATAIDISSVVYGGVRILNSTSASYMSLQCTSTPTSLVYDASTSIPTQFDFTGLTTTSVNNTVIHAFAYKSNSCAYSVNGTTAETDNSATMTTMNHLNIGGAGSQTISRIAYYPIRLSDAEIESITTL